MRKLFSALLVTSFAMFPLQAETSSKRVKPSPTPGRGAPAAQAGKPAQPTPRPSFFERLFGRRLTPTPTPSPTPAPVVKRRPRPKVSSTTEVVPKVEPTPGTVAPPPGPRPKTVKSGTKKGAATAGVSTGADDVTKFRAAKAQALEDPRIKELKSKADGEVNEADAHKALLNYNRALFQKIREVDPSVSDYSGRVEQSMTKRLGAEKGND